MKYLGDRKSWAVAVATSLSILLFNLVVIEWWFKISGAPHTSQQTVVQYVFSFSMAFLRIVLFYLMLLWRIIWDKK